MSPMIWYLLIFLCCMKGVVLSYSKDEVALAICTAETNGSMTFYGRVLAVRRTCTNPGKKCKDICKEQGATYHCFDAVHIYSRSTLKYLAAHRYLLHGCDATYCGPNYCCCGQ
ncbi:Hypothetical predicted protein [Mytilus galloprovincialis]|uniref:Uncharacterized protein n=1 Tax=Mytilus galloprovincialis TaxID=29158 RepID=A0A8B6DVH4_MYTGA|nr:Hypothetical predicted protein [Mytilus galloprovincialis]